MVYRALVHTIVVCTVLVYILLELSFFLRPTSKSAFTLSLGVQLLCLLIVFFFELSSGRASVRNNGSYRGNSRWSRITFAVGSSFGNNAGKALKCTAKSCPGTFFSLGK